MIKLEPKEYTKLLTLLPKEGMNTLFAEAVLMGLIQGEVLADRQEQPTWFYILHPCHMSLLIGESDAVTSVEELKVFLLNEKGLRNEIEWMQVYPPSWNPLLEKVLGHQLIDKGPDEQYRKPLPADENSCVIRYRRSDFAFQTDRYELYRQRNQPDNLRIKETDHTIYPELENGVVPKLFWDSYGEFQRLGTGFTAFTPDETPASTAFAAFVIGNLCEIGIETIAEYRGQGYAHRACSRLIEYCLEKAYIPIWGCNSGNIGSWRLANKLGFEEVARRPYYRLPV